MVGRFTLAAAAALALVALACNGDGAPENPSPRAGPTLAPASPAPAPSPVIPPAGEAPVDALRLYLRETGLDDKKGDLTDPIDCGEAEQTGAEGEFCLVVNAGVYAPALAILFVSRLESRDAWQVHVDLDVQSSTWKVTNVTPLGKR